VPDERERCASIRRLCASPAGDNAFDSIDLLNGDARAAGRSDSGAAGARRSSCSAR